MAACDSLNDKMSKPFLPKVSLGNTEPHSVDESSHSKLVLEGLYQHFKDERFCDVALVFGKKEIKAHKVVLASSSQYFEAMFSVNFSDGTQQRLKINGVDENVGEALIEFAYSGKIKITSENVIELLAGANFLQGFEAVEKSCSEYLKKHSSKDNLFQILEVADHFHQIDLKMHLKQFCVRNFVDCVENDHKAFLNLSESMLKDLISSQELIVLRDNVVLLGRQQEEYLLEKVIEYIKHNQEMPLKITEILRCVHLPLLKKQFLQSLKSNKLFKSRECFTLFENALKAKKVKKSSEEKPKPKWAKQRACGEYQVWKGRCIASGGQVSNEVDVFDDMHHISPEKDYISGMELWIRRWDGRPVLGGMKVHYSSGKSVMHGSDKATEKEEFTLEPGERIVKVDCQSGWMIDNMTFYTNKDRKLGPYGGPGGGFRHETPPGCYGYLLCINGSVVDTQNDLGITRLQFVWRFFRLPGEKPVPDYTDPVDYDFLDEYYDDDDDDNYYDDYDDYFDYDDFYDIEDEEGFDHEVDDWHHDWVDDDDEIYAQVFAIPHHHHGDCNADGQENLDNEVD